MVLTAEEASKLWDNIIAATKESWKDKEPKACSENSCEIIENILRSPLRKWVKPERKIILFTNTHPKGGVDLLPMLRVHKHFFAIGILGKILFIKWR